MISSLQRALLIIFTEIWGRGFTKTIAVAVAEQPNWLVPTAEYEDVTEGETEISELL